jgi:hypothetical protein
MEIPRERSPELHPDGETVEDSKQEPTAIGERPEVVMLESAASTAIFANLLAEYYEPFELWHLRTSVDKVCLQYEQLPSYLPTDFHSPLIGTSIIRSGFSRITSDNHDTG